MLQESRDTTVLSNLMLRPGWDSIKWNCIPTEHGRNASRLNPRNTVLSYDSDKTRSLSTEPNGIGLFQAVSGGYTECEIRKISDWDYRPAASWNNERLGVVQILANIRGYLPTHRQILPFITLRGGGTYLPPGILKVILPSAAGRRPIFLWILTLVTTFKHVLDDTGLSSKLITS